MRQWALVTLLVLAFLVPAACVLWFMRESAATQAVAARHRVLDAYRGQLRLAGSRVDARWDEYAARLDGDDRPALRFARLVLDQAADGVVLLHDDGTVAYPDAATMADTSGMPASSDREAAGAGTPALAARLLLEIRRTAPDGADRAQAIDRVAALLNDYARDLPPHVRLARMDELRALAPNVWLPTHGALRLSTDVAAAGVPVVVAGGFRPAGVRDVWALRSRDGRAIGLYRTGRLEAMLHDVLHEVAPEGIRFIAFPPGMAGGAEAIPAGSRLPGWQLSFEPLDMTPFDAAERQAVMTSISIGIATLAVMALIGVTAGRALGKQLHVARLKTDLVAAVSHELRTPVTSVGVLVERLLDDPQPDAARTREYLRIVAAENARLARLIESFLTFARLDRHAQQFVFAPEAPHVLVTAAIEAVRDRLPPGCTIAVDLPADLPLVLADRDALVTALVNLLDNAIKYTADEPRIRVRAVAERGFVVFAVQDNGIGIPSREQRRIFRRFHRLDQRLARETGGVGLGLSIVELIVRAHGGTVGVTSDAGAGSTFTLRLPCADGVPA